MLQELWWPVTPLTTHPTPSLARSSPPPLSRQTMTYSSTWPAPTHSTMAGSATTMIKCRLYCFKLFISLYRMYLGEACKAGAPQFENGTTNGAGWYPLTGGMQVWHELRNAHASFAIISYMFPHFSKLIVECTGLQLHLARVYGGHAGTLLL
jgi:hypothetical protein